MRCNDCAYFFKYENEQHPSCKYGYNDGYAPCEADETEAYYEEEQ